MRQASFLSAVWLGLLLIPKAAFGGLVVYQDNNFEFNFIALGDDGSAGRPTPGDHLGNQIHLAPGNWLLTSATVTFGAGNDGNEPFVQSTDTYTLTLYDNDGPGGQPGSILASSSVVAQDDSVFDVTFTFNNVSVPSNLTAVVSSTHPIDTFPSGIGIVGPLSTSDVPGIGSGPNLLWSNTNSALTSWVPTTDWATSDGATTNYFNMTLTATPRAPPSVVPEPPSLLLFLLSCPAFMWVKLRT